MKILKEQEDKVLFKTDWISVLETERGFQYLERKGKNSIALFLIREGRTGWEVLVRYQPLPLQNNDDSLFPCPITGSIDAEEFPAGTAVRECLEETGYSIALHELRTLDEYVVGTQTNETVYMYYCDVSNKISIKPKTDGGYHESISYNNWEFLSNLKSYNYSACQIGFYKLNEILNDF
jgi:8-oxo-dGTP pyrophosphatase MutT (NUDIX family)